MEILIAEDGQAERFLIKATLAKLGYEVVVTCDGEEAWLALSREDAPRLAILDWMMPGMDGTEICRKFRETYSSRPVYIILLTARTGKEDLIEGLQAGADDYLAKPFDSEELHVRVQVGERILNLQKGLADRAKELEAEIVERRRVEEEVLELNEGLERRVVERTAQLEAANEELEAFTYSVSHDLRAPLRSIDGFSQILLEDYARSLDAEGQNYLHRVRAAGQRMAALIEDLLKLSRMTRREMRLGKVDLSVLTREIADELRQDEAGRQVAFVIEKGVMADGDAGLLRMVLENLLGNAWKYTCKHLSARIEFGVARQDGQVAYFVRDDGAGFDAAYADRLFGAFQRLHSETEFEGTGIGLATVQRIIHRHGGRVWAEGAVEQGATFYFTLSK
ncbi:MAG: response regulator [Anaerolineae bacterium]